MTFRNYGILIVKISFVEHKLTIEIKLSLLTLKDIFYKMRLVFSEVYMKNVQKIIKFFLLSLMISFFLEIFIFNFRTFQSLFYHQENLTDKITYNGIEKNSDNSFTVTDEENNYIEIENINQKINNIKLDFDISKKYIEYIIYATDEANSEYLQLNNRYLYPSIEKSKYVKLNMYGNSSKIKIEFINKGVNIKIKDISINERVPFDISLIRLLLVFGIIFVFLIFRSKSEFYKYKVDFKNKYQIGIMIFWVLIISFVFGCIIYKNPTSRTYVKHHQQYQELTESLLKGKVSLDIEPTKELLELENPYDYYLRTKIEEETNKKIGQWDHAFYNGKYYVYFGIGPAIFGYLPYYVLFGKHITNYVIVLVISILTLIGMLLLLKEVTKRYFKNIPFLLFIIMYSFLASILLKIVSSPAIYIVPIAYALMFTFFGLYFMISSIKKDKISTPLIMVGSICMALVASCRPQFLVGSFLLIPIFWDSVFKDRTLFSKKSVKQTIAFIMPYIIVAGLLMFYNYIRFDSILEFGSNYQITNMDMAKRGFKLDRIGFAIFTLLFQLPILKATFPFIQNTLDLNNYMGDIKIGIMFGGILVTNLLLWLGIFSFKFKKYLSKTLYNFSCLAIVLALIVLIFDVEVSAIASRYVLDFSWLIFLPTIWVVFGLFNSNISKKVKEIILKVILVVLFIYFVYQFLLLLQDQFFNNLLNNAPNFYFKWYYMLQWWL